MPASESVRFGRKRPLPSCPNPLFLKWLTELRDEAKEKGLKIHYTYHKVNKRTFVFFIVNLVSRHLWTSLMLLNHKSFGKTYQIRGGCYDGFMLTVEKQT